MMVNETDKEPIYNSMGINTLEKLKIIKNMGKELIYGQMEQNTLESGKMQNFTD